MPDHPGASAHPTFGNVIHISSFRQFSGDFLSLTLGADEQNIAALADNILEEVAGIGNLTDGLGKIDDGDTVSGTEDKLLHLGVPAFGLMSEMTPGFEQIVYSEFRHDLNLSVRYGHFSRRRETAFLLKCSGKFRVLF